MNLHLQLCWLRAFLPCLSPYSSWWYRSSAVLCLGCFVVMLVHSCISLHHIALCSLGDLFVLQPSRAREESSRASGSTGDVEQLECTYQMYSTCLHVPLQDFFWEKFHCALCSICTFPHRSLDSWEYQHTLLDVVCWVMWNCCLWSWCACALGVDFLDTQIWVSSSDWPLSYLEKYLRICLNIIS